MKKFGLALGGGGAKGVAHIEYIRTIEESGLRPHIISGTSIGALIGALYAGGMKPDDMYGEMARLFSSKSEPFNHLKQLRGGLLCSFVRNYLKSIMPRYRFEDLDIPLKIVSTNFHTLEEKVFSEGDLLEAVMASIAFPRVFAPQKVGNEYYIDGGATNILPFDIIRGDCDVLIAIDVSSVRANNYKETAKKSLSATWAAAQQALISMKLRHCPVEILERPDFHKVSTMQFYKYKKVTNQTQAYLPAFKDRLQRAIDAPLAKISVTDWLSHLTEAI